MEKYKNKLTNFELLVTCKYFNSINDIINLIFTTKKAKFFFERLDYNPFSLTIKTKKLFPNLRYLNLFSKDDEKFGKELNHNIKAPVVRRCFFLFLGENGNIMKRNLVSFGEVIMVFLYVSFIKNSLK